MTTSNLPNVGRAVACRPPMAGPLLRQVFPVPPSLRLDDIGALCPLDDVVLTRQVDGWACPSCGAAWDHQGHNGWWPITPAMESVDQDDAPPARAGRAVRVAVAGVVVAGPAAVAVAAGRRYAEHTDAAPDLLLYSPAAALGLVAAVVAGRRVVRWVDERRHGLAVDVDEADLNPLGKELLAQVRARRGEVS